VTTPSDIAPAHLIALPLTPRQLGFMLQIPVLMMIGFFLLAYNALWGIQTMAAVFRQPVAGIALLAAYPLGILVHEWLHAFGFAVFGGAPWKAIRIGVFRLTAFCQCDAPVHAEGFRAAIILPGLVLGMLPVAVALIFGFGWWLLFGALMASAALGDVLILWALRNVRPSARIVYHPRIGRYEITLK
jgi:hypothetical protein